MTEGLFCLLAFFASDLSKFLHENKKRLQMKTLFSLVQDS